MRTTMKTRGRSVGSRTCESESKKKGKKQKKKDGEKRGRWAGPGARRTNVGMSVITWYLYSMSAGVVVGFWWLHWWRCAVISKLASG